MIQVLTQQQTIIQSYTSINLIKNKKIEGVITQKKSWIYAILQFSVMYLESRFPVDDDELFAGWFEWTMTDSISHCNQSQVLLHYTLFQSSYET